MACLVAFSAQAREAFAESHVLAFEYFGGCILVLVAAEVAAVKPPGPVRAERGDPSAVVMHLLRVGSSGVQVGLVGPWNRRNGLRQDIPCDVGVPFLLDRDRVRAGQHPPGSEAFARREEVYAPPPVRGVIQPTGRRAPV